VRTMKFDYIFVPRGLMESIDVLGRQRDPGSGQHPVGEGEVSRVGPTGRHPLATPPVPFPDQAGISREGLRSRKLFRPKRSPKSLGTAKGGHTGLGAHAGAGQDQDGASVGEKRGGRGSGHDQAAGAPRAVNGMGPAQPVAGRRPAYPPLTALLSVFTRCRIAVRP